MKTHFLQKVIKFQDHGNMNIMHSSMMKFRQSVCSIVQESLNYTAYIKHGPDFYAYQSETY